MPFTTPYGTLWRLHEAWRAEVLEAEQRYKQDRNEETAMCSRIASIAASSAFNAWYRAGPIP